MAASIQIGQGQHPQRRRERTLLLWIKRGLRVLLMGLPTLATAGTIYQFVATKGDQRKFGPAPGEMVSVGDHKLHISCMGQGSPTVILESGTPGTSIEWSAWVQPEVAKATRVCAYDRAGLGWSEPGLERAWTGPQGRRADNERVAHPS